MLTRSVIPAPFEAPADAPAPPPEPPPWAPVFVQFDSSHQPDPKQPVVSVASQYVFVEAPRPATLRVLQWKDGHAIKDKVLAGTVSEPERAAAAALRDALVGADFVNLSKPAPKSPEAIPLEGFRVTVTGNDGFVRVATFPGAAPGPFGAILDAANAYMQVAFAKP